MTFKVGDRVIWKGTVIGDIIASIWSPPLYEYVYEVDFGLNHTEKGVLAKDLVHYNLPRYNESIKKPPVTKHGWVKFNPKTKKFTINGEDIG